MKYAIVKLNNGRGALLCNGCRVILKTGFYHPDIKHYCDDCKLEKEIFKNRIAKGD